MIDHGKVDETYVAEILQNKMYRDLFIYLKTSINEFIWNKIFSSGFMWRTI